MQVDGNCIGKEPRSALGGVWVEGIRRCGDRSEVRPTLWIALVL